MDVYSGQGEGACVVTFGPVSLDSGRAIRGCALYDPQHGYSLSFIGLCD